MSFNIIATDVFQKQFRRLLKKYSSLKEDLSGLVKILKENQNQGTSLGNHCYKIRLRIKSKVSGKSAGARIIYYVYYEEYKIYLLSIYDKSEMENISAKEIKSILEQLEI